MAMQFKPYEYQERAIQHILDHPVSGLFLDMGLGKSVITLTALTEILHDRFECRKVLVIAPKRVAEMVWEQEIDKWDHTEYLTVSKIVGNEPKRIRALLRRAEIYVIGRDNLEWLVNYLGPKNWDFDCLVVDELSSFKNSKSRRFRALRKVRPFCERVIGLTGTPAPNGLLDLWSQMYILDMGERLGVHLGSYKESYFEPDKKGYQSGQQMVYSYRPKRGAEDKIYKQIADICLSMSAKDWLDLKEPILRYPRVELEPKEIELYERMEKDLLLSLDEGDVIATTAAVLSGKLMQMANGAVYDEHRAVHHIHDVKLDALGDLIEAANGRPILVCYAYQHDLERMQKRFPQIVKLETEKQLDAWNRKEIEVMAMHPQSAGHGLNMQQGGNHLVWFSVPWSLELYQQAIGRLQRQGQVGQVVVHHLVARGTIDEDVIMAIADKEAGQDALLNAVKARIVKVRAKTG